VKFFILHILTIYLESLFPGSYHLALTTSLPLLCHNNQRNFEGKNSGSTIHTYNLGYPLTTGLKQLSYSHFC